MEEFEPKRRIKIINKEFILKYSYVFLLAILLIGGITYGYTFFTENNKIASGSITTANLSINFSNRNISASNLSVPTNDQEGLSEFSKSLTITNQTAIDGRVKLSLTRTSGLALNDLRYALVVNGAIQEIDDVPSDGEILSSAIMGNETVNVEVRLWPKSTYSGSGTTFVGELTPQISYLGETATNISSPAGKYVNFNCSGNTCEVWQIVKVEDGRLVLTRQADYSGATSRTNSNRYNSSLTFNDNSLITSVSTDNLNVYLAKTVKINGGSGTLADPYTLTNNIFNEEDKKVIAVITYKDDNNTTVGTQNIYYNEANYISQVIDDPDFEGWSDGTNDYELGDTIAFTSDTNLTAIMVPKLRTQIMAKCNDSSITYVQKYTASQGTTTDTYDERGTEDVCYYTSTTSSNIAGANGNVIFGDYCWQIVRTTDTGGIKLLYNGPKTTDGKCTSDSQSNYSSNPRPSSIGVVGAEQGTKNTTLSGDKLYGSKFEIFNDNGTNKFRLLDTNTYNWSNSTYQDIIGKYTCLNTSDTCTAMYYVGEYQNNTQASTEKYTIGTNAHYSQIGTSPFNAYYNSLALIGYMYGDAPNNLQKDDFYTYFDVIDRESVSSNYYYGDEAIWVTDHYELRISGATPTTTSSWSSVRSSAGGMYTCRNTTDTSCSTVYYIVANSTNEYMYYIPLSNNESASTKSLTWTIGTGYEDNNGTYSLTGTSTLTILLKDWYTSYSNSQYRNYYVCDNKTSSTCTNEVYYVGAASSYRLYYNKSSTTYVFGNSVTYENGVYKIDEYSDPTKFQTIWNWFLDYGNISNSHYTCFGRYNKNTRSCGSSVYYVNYTASSMAIYFELKNGDTIETLLKNTINHKQNSNEQDANINVYNSSIKGIVDNFYETKLTSSEKQYLDSSATFCNDRSVRTKGGFNPTGGLTTSPSNNLYFLQSSSDTNLSCTNITDRFSTENTKAQLTYPIGLLSSQEMRLANIYYIDTAQEVWTMSPACFGNNGLVLYFGAGSYGYRSIEYSKGVRPVIVLKSDVTITGGNGTYNSPYVVDTSGS